MSDPIYPSRRWVILNAEGAEWEEQKAGALRRWDDVTYKQMREVYNAAPKYSLCKRVCGTIMHEGNGIASSVSAGRKNPGWLLMWITLAEYILEKETKL